MFLCLRLEIMKKECVFMIIPAAVVIESADSAFGIFAKVISTCPFESRTIFALKCTHLAEST